MLPAAFDIAPHAKPKTEPTLLHYSSRTEAYNLSMKQLPLAMPSMTVVTSAVSVATLYASTAMADGRVRLIPAIELFEVALEAASCVALSLSAFSRSRCSFSCLLALGLRAAVVLRAPDPPLLRPPAGRAAVVRPVPPRLPRPPRPRFVGGTDLKADVSIVKRVSEIA